MASPSPARPFGARDQVGYALGDLGNDLTFVLVSTYFMIFATNVAGLDPVHLGFVMLGARLLDAFYDVAVGRFLDLRPAGPGGKFRPWIPRLSPVVAAVAVACFVPAVAGWGYAAKLAWLGAGYFCFGIAYSTLNIPYGSMAALISPEPQQRAALSVSRSVGAMIATGLVMLGLPQVVNVAVDGRPVLDGVRLFGAAVALGAAAVVAHVACFRLVRERVPAAATGEHGSLGDVLGSLARNRSLAALIVVGLVLLLTLGLVQALMPYLWLDYFAQPRLQSLAGLAMVAPALLLAPVATRLSARFGKKELGVGGMVLSAACGLVLFVTQTRDPWVFIGLMTGATFGQCLFNLLVWAFITDVTDAHEVATGDRDDGTIYAAYSWSRKVGQALSSGLGAWVLGWIGYRTGGVAQSPETIRGLFLASTLIPGLLCVVLGVVLAWWYPLSRARVARNAALLADRRTAVVHLSVPDVTPRP